MESILYHQLFPQVRTLGARELLDSLPWTRSAESLKRPYTVANFVVSADGRTTVGGSSRALSDSGDRELHRSLRERVDAVLAGTGTVEAEDYGRMLPAAERRERRLAAARAAEPLTVMVTRSGRLPLDVRLFFEPAAHVVVFSPDPPTHHSAATVTHERHGSSTPLATLMQTLRLRHGAQTLLCEGGPTLFAALLRERLVDELFLTLAPTLAGDAGPAVTSAATQEALPEPTGLTLAGLMQREGCVFARYLLS